MTVLVDGIPAELRARDHWVMWRLASRDGGKPTKLPFTVSGAMASSTNPATWASFGAVLDTDGYSGIGYVFADSDPYVGIDLDNSIGDDGKLKPWAQKLVDRFKTYTEISPSGKGVKMWCKGVYHGQSDDETGRRVKFKDGAVEMYHKGRYFAVTGQRYPGTQAQITEQQSGIDGLYSHVLNPPSKPVAAPTDIGDRCVKYLTRMPDAVSGQDGHGCTLRAACECYRFGLMESEALGVMQWFNANKCRPAWTDREIQHKLADALKKVRSAGEFGCRLRQIDPPVAPLEKPPADVSSTERVLAETADGKRVNIAWPWKSLTVQARALLPGTVTVLSGMGGSSKSLLISQACLHWLSAGISFAVFHLEEDRDFHTIRALAQLERDSRMTIDDYAMVNPDEVFAAFDRHKPTLEALGASMWDAPTRDLSLTDLQSWLLDRASEGRRIIVIDPVTAADSGREPWLADRRFILGAKRTLRESGASLVVVTHPRDGNPKHGGRMDNHAGGQAYNRFTQCVLELEAIKPTEQRVRHPTADLSTSSRCNRTLAIRKARNGPGAMRSIGFWFGPDSLTFEECGVMEE